MDFLLDVLHVNSTDFIDVTNRLHADLHTGAYNISTEYVTMLLLSVLSAGGTASQDCWFDYPLSCNGCHYQKMKAPGLPHELVDSLNVLDGVCKAIKGVVTPQTIGLNDLTLHDLQRKSLYEPTMRPHFSTKSELIYVNLQLMSIENLDITDSSFKMDFYLYQEWYDYRLRHNYPDVLHATSLSKEVWIPDTYFVQSKVGEYNSLDKTLSLKIRSDGMVSSTIRLMIQVSCQLDFSNFPMDVQSCLLSLESYGHDHTEIIYVWKNEDVTIPTKFRSTILSQYDLKPLRKYHMNSQYIIGNWSTLVIEFVFVRNSIIFIPALYCPCAIVVFISWMTFFLDHEHYPARTYLNVTSILTIMTVQAALYSSTPKVSYVKAIDTYVMISKFFISIAFIEYAIVLFVNRKKAEYLVKKKQKLKMTYRIRKKLLERNLLRNNSENNTSVKNYRYEEVSKNMLDMDKQLLTNYNRIWKFFLRDGWPQKFDICARILFPIAFIAFNGFYWVTFLQRGSKS